GLLGGLPVMHRFVVDQPLLAATIFGALAFPLAKALIETFDGSQAFFRRVGNSYRNSTLYTRGAVVGLCLGLGVVLAMAQEGRLTRVLFGFGLGIAAFSGVDWLRDLVRGGQGRGRLQSWRVYRVHALLGGFIGAALGFYFDAAQVDVVVAKYHRYLA